MSGNVRLSKRDSRVKIAQRTPSSSEFGVQLRHVIISLNSRPPLPYVLFEIVITTLRLHRGVNAMSTIQSERTPNPNSLKFSSADGRFSDTVVAMTSTDEADRHPLGDPLFAIDGVDDVFVTPEFVTVSKTASAEWQDLQSDVESVLTDFLDAEASS